MNKKSTVAISQESVLKLKTIVEKMNDAGMMMNKGRYLEILINSFGEMISNKLIEKHKKETENFEEKIMKMYKGELK